MDITSYKIKTALLHYFRFKRQCYVGTEVSYGLGQADVLAVVKKDNKIYEGEVKISKADFLNEWKHKEHKHKHLLLGNIINYFYFCVPKDLEEFVLSYIKDTSYGLLIFKEAWTHKNKLQETLVLEDSITVSKKAIDLLQEYPNKDTTINKIKDLIALRSMSEIATMYKERYYETKRSENIIRTKEIV